MFQAIVHAPEMRAGARLCLSDLRQTVDIDPRVPASGDAVGLRFGACCARLDVGCILAADGGQATLRVGTADWRLKRCSEASGIRVPGLVSENWFVVDRLA